MGEERSSRMGQENFDFPILDSVHQQTRAHSPSHISPYLLSAKMTGTKGHAVGPSCRNMEALSYSISQRKLSDGLGRSGLSRRHADQSAAQHLPLKRVARRDRFSHARMGRRRSLVIDQVVGLFIERVIRLGFEWTETQAAVGIATCALELSELLDQGRLARAHAGLVQGVNVIQDSHRTLQPFTFTPTQFVHS